MNVELSLQISRLARVDGTLTKTVAMLTLVFLLATFLSAVFSMSFFSYQAGEEWKMSRTTLLSIFQFRDMGLHPD
jgi:hypothetical protein